MAGLTLHQLVSAVRGRRRERGWSQEELARRTGVSRIWVHDLERGGGGASIEAVLRVLDVLGIAIGIVRDEPPDESDHVDLDALIERHRE